MRFYPVVTSAAFVTTLLAGSTFATPALAQKAAVLAPVTPWAITKVDAKNGQDGYCAMARRFNQNTILTLARNGSNETSLALDFQMPKMKMSENIKVVLDPGAGEERSYYISPVSSQAFVVRLGRDEKFFHALQKTGLLRIEAGGDSYNFNLADIDTGQSSLASCVISVAPDGSTKQVTADNGSYENQIQQLRQDVEGLRKENQRLSGLVGDKEAGASDGVVIEKLSSTADNLQQENNNLKQQTGMSGGQVYGSLKQENDRLRDQLAGLSVEDDGARAVHDRLATLEQQNQDLRNDMGMLPDASQWRETQAQVYTLREENRRLQSLLEQKSGYMTVADAQQLQGKVETLQQEKSQLKNILEDAQNAVPPPMPAAPIPGTSSEAAPAPANDLQKKVDDLMAQLREKDQQLVEFSSLKVEAENLRTHNQELEAKLADAAKDKDTIAGLNDKVKSLEEENAQLKSGAPGGGDNSAQIDALTKENADLKSQIDGLKQAQQQLDDAKARIAGLEQENAALKQNPPANPQQASAETDQMKQEIESLKKENSDLKDRIAANDKQVEGLQADLKAAQEKVASAAPAKDGAQCKAQVASEVKKAKDDADEEKQVEMASLARENMDLKKQLAAIKGGAAAPVAAAAAPVKDAAASGVQDVPEQEISPAVENDDGAMTDAQRQEAQMMQSMKNPPRMAGTEPKAKKAGKKADQGAHEDIAWNTAAVPTDSIDAQPLAAPAAAPVNNTMPAPAAVNEQAPVAIAPQGAAAPAADNAAGFAVPDAIANAQIAPAGQVAKVDSASGPNHTAWQWRSGGIYGSAEQMPLGAGFDSSVQQYLAKTKSRCNGDFAASPDGDNRAGAYRISNYEIACVGKDVSSTASLLFTDRGGFFTVIAHETAADKMEDAMNLRDKLAKSLATD